MWKLKKKKKLILPFKVKKEQVKGEPFYHFENRYDGSIIEMPISEVLNLISKSHKDLKIQVMRDYFKSENKTIL
jgi:hypothetical protein